MEAAMQVARWGNSLAVRLPKKVVDELGLKAGDEVELVSAGKRRLEVAKRDKRAEFLEKMKQFNFPLPEDYKFDRDEANER
jgi:antitoxin MazE